MMALACLLPPVFIAKIKHYHYITYKSGSRDESCGTPDIVSNVDDITLLIRT